MTNFTIVVRNNDVEKAIKKMKTKTAKLGVLKTYRERSRYEKPSDKRVRLMKANIINSKLKKRKREKNL
ncbi:30S ribosomal protein S21 [Pelagibacter phage Aegir EXVC013S]|nr:30S ribosomal protein S21 [Pelagibacter phage Aegir EXVC013S]QLF88493.1 30S ribosomal protein S21 [Pelagibacter phage Kolga EXVC016S]|tara:strand:- start:424 stop:630 length:207 start_codon:yes stop_codon:yes gene_type:complete